MTARTTLFSPWILSFSGARLPTRVAAAIRRGRAGGVLLFRDNLGGDLASAAEMRREIRSLVPDRMPFLFFMDEEGGLISQTAGLTEGRSGPWPAVPTPRALGRVDSLSDTRLTGRVLGRRLRAIGVQVDLAPCLDLDTEPENPVIGSRCYGGDPAQAAEHGWAFSCGLMEVGVAACFKHFPGHGATRVDSHKALPVLDPKGRILHESPFRLCLERAKRDCGEPPAPFPGSLTPWVMNGHIDWGTGIAATLDPQAARRLGRWNARCLRITDALDMKAIDLGGDAAERAQLAGNDALLIGRDWMRGLSAIDRWGAALERDPALRSAWHTARRRARPFWMGLDREIESVSGGWGRDTDRLRELHRLAVRLTVAPAELPRGPWLWIVPEGLHPYARLREWRPPKGRARFCQEVLWVPERATASWLSATAARLGRETRPILLATLFRGSPPASVRRAWRPILALPNVRVVAHLLDEVWPRVGEGEGGTEGEGETSPSFAVALTSGPSAGALQGLAEALGLPDGAWNRAGERLYFPVDTNPPDSVE